MIEKQLKSRELAVKTEPSALDRTDVWGAFGESIKMGNERKWDNFIKVNGIFKKFKELVFIVIIFILVVGKNIYKRELFMC